MDPGRRKFAIIAVSLLVLVLVVIGILHVRARPQLVAAQRVGGSAFTIALPESGVVQYPQIQTLTSQIPGNVGHIFVKAGDRVGAGQLLATVENPEILSNAQSSSAAYRAASAKSQSAAVTGTSNVVAAEANVEAARTRLAQAQQDMASGVESGAGSGETTAAEQRAQAEANLATAATELRESRRIFLAYSDLYGNKAVSRDQLDRAQAKYQQAQAAYREAVIARDSLGRQLVRSQSVVRDNLRSAQEGYAEAQSALATARVESGGGDVAAASAEAARAAAENAFAQEQANATEIRAPYDATVLNVATEKSDSLRPLQPGDAVDAGQALLTLAARRAFVVRTRIDEQDVINVRLGERVQITGEDFPGRVLSGHVSGISPIAQKNDESSPTRTVATTVAVDAAPAFLRDGMSVDVNIFTTDLRDAIVVPNEAILRNANLTYVYVVRNGVAYRAPVRLGASSETQCVVLAGLKNGDTVVDENVPGLKDGAAVEF
jgi:RND family efflux transporter MFP subunit